MKITKKQLNKTVQKVVSECLKEALKEGVNDRFDKLDQIREHMSDEDILVELVKMMPDHVWEEYHQTLMQYFGGDPDYGA